MITTIDADIKNILFNILGGIIVAIFTWLIIKTKGLINNYKFRRLFGHDSIRDFRLVYGKMYLKSPCYDKNSVIIDSPYFKPGKPYVYKLSSILSNTEAVSIKYISDCFTRVTNLSPEMTSDEAIIDRFDLSYMAFGGLNNEKSILILDSPQNEFYKFGVTANNIISLNNDVDVYYPTPTTDYALIIKISPSQCQKRTHFCVAGIGEAGTRGASYFLGKNWRMILRKTKGKDFGIIIKVSNNNDESAEIVKFQIKN